MPVHTNMTAEHTLTAIRLCYPSMPQRTGSKATAMELIRASLRMAVVNAACKSAWRTSLDVRGRERRAHPTAHTMHTMKTSERGSHSLYVPLLQLQR